MLGTYAGPQPIGVVYHPVENRMYFPWTHSTEVREYDTTTLTQVGSYNFEHNFSSTGNWAFRQGRMKISRDGSILVASVTGGVRYVQLYPGLQASDSDLGGTEDTPLNINLTGSIGNGGGLQVTVTGLPSNGQLSGSAPNLVYTPDANYNGSDEIRYQVSYGNAVVEASVLITLDAVNDLPVANPDSAITKRRRSVCIAVLDNDSDVDNLTVVSVSEPQRGAATINSDNTITYTPSKRFKGTDFFTYTVSDNNGGTATAQVSVEVVRR